MGTVSGGYVRSLDDGASWQPVVLPVAGSLAIAPDGSLWYVITWNGALHRSDDEGAGWTLVTSNVGGTGNVRASIAATDEALVIARGNPFITLQRSTDGGVTWLSSPLPNLAFPSEVLGFRRTRDGTLYALSYQVDGFSWMDFRDPALFSSSNNGASWGVVVGSPVSDVFLTAGGQRLIGYVEELVGGPPGFRAAGPSGLVEAPDGTLYVNAAGFYIPGSEGSAVWSGTGAYRWDPDRDAWMQVGIAPAPVRALERDAEGRLLAGYATAFDRYNPRGAVLRVEGGAWTAAGFNHSSVQDLLTLDDGRTLVADQQVGIATLGEQPASGGCGGCGAWAVAETAVGTLLAGVSVQYSSPQGMILHSEDGETWEPVYQGEVIRTLSVAPDGPVYAGAHPFDAWDDEEGVLVSHDDGETWQALAPPDGRALALLARSGAEVYLGTPSGVYRTTDGGATWSADGLEGDSVVAFTTSAVGVLAGTPGGLFLRGASGWQPYGQGLDGRAVYAIRTEATAVGERLIIGTDRGVYASEPLVTTTGEIPPPVAPTRLAVAGVRPLPIRGAATATLTLPEATHARLVLLDVLGRELATVLDRPMEAGTHEVPFTVGLSAGTYLLRLNAGGATVSRAVSIAR